MYQVDLDGFYLSLSPFTLELWPLLFFREGMERAIMKRAPEPESKNDEGKERESERDEDPILDPVPVM